VVLLLALSFLYTGRGTHPKSGENPPTATQSQPQK
jgi:hypothetical protein